MMKENKSPYYKTAVVCMVYDGYEYLSEFINFYTNICDHIYIIDHHSKRDLRQLYSDNITCVRSNHEAQFQSECTNIVIENFNLKKKYDWVFVLDIDEFLPFFKKQDIQNFLHKHRNDYVVKMHWRNGVPFDDISDKSEKISLIDCRSIRFFDKSGRQYKTLINIAKTKGQFFVPTGAHTICRIMSFWRLCTPFLRKRKDYIPASSDLNLFHVVAFDKESFVKKIKNYMKQFEYRSHVARQGGGMVGDYPEKYSDDEWLWYIGNFRVKDPDCLYDVKKENFIEENIFEHLNKSDVVTLKNSILDCSAVSQERQSLEEVTYLKHKKNDRDVLENMKWFRITPEKEIITIIPKENKC